MNVSPMTVLLMPESAYGPTNNCIGIGRVLQRRGHGVVFAAETSWNGKLTALGFEEALVDLAPPATDSDTQDAGQFWKDFIQPMGKPELEFFDTASLGFTRSAADVDTLTEAILAGMYACRPPGMPHAPGGATTGA